MLNSFLGKIAFRSAKLKSFSNFISYFGSLVIVVCDVFREASSPIIHCCDCHKAVSVGHTGTRDHTQMVWEMSISTALANVGK